ncbi:MAG: CAP domain-containing protein [Patescibacteria group bacterium]|jgi:hypothetical protein|nr:CAP domain-containing protein [Patescibacteria group bacterium]
MNNLNRQQYFLILANFKRFYIILLLFVGVFLFPKIAYLSSISPEKIIELSNQERIINNLEPLNANQYLGQAAYNKAQDIFKNQRFEHNFDDRRFSAWVRDVEYRYKYVGENLAIDFVTSEGVMDAWQKSPTHYKNIVNDKFSEIGVAVVEDNFKNEKSILVVQIFGTPLNNQLSLNLDEEYTLANKQNKKVINNQTNYLTHTSQNNINLLEENKLFLNLQNEDNLAFVEDAGNDKKYLDLLFTIAGFIYLGIFKLVNLKNIGL